MSMKRHYYLSAIFAIVTVAFFFGLAPIFHAVCVSALSGQTSSQMSHVMADGTVMTMATEVSPDVMNVDSSPLIADEPFWSNSSPGTAHVMGTIMITAGLAFLTFFGLRYCKQAFSRYFLAAHSKSILAIQFMGGIARARPPSEVDLTSLSISRT